MGSKGVSAINYKDRITYNFSDTLRDAIVF